jgi:hypothetical protein
MQEPESLWSWLESGYSMCSKHLMHRSVESRCLAWDCSGAIVAIAALAPDA